MQKVFISHPYSDDPEENFKRADDICREIMRNYDNILPISPLHTFSFISSDYCRADVMDWCFGQIKECDAVWVFGSSEGCQQERKFAKKLGKIVRDMR